MTAASVKYRRPRVLIDVDGPMTDTFFTDVCARLVAAGFPVRREDLRSWYIFEAHNIPTSTERAIRDLIARPGEAANYLPRPGLAEFLRRLRGWADVYAVTAPFDGSLTWAHDRERWLEVEGFTKAEIIHARDKRVIVGDAFVDDKLEHVTQWQREFPRGVAVLWTENYNAGDPWTGPRASNYRDLTELLETLRIGDGEK